MGCDAFLSFIGLFPFSCNIEGWLPCEGQLLNIMQNQALFSLLGTQFGGDGHSTFALPNLKDKAPLPGLRYLIATQGIYPIRE
jgi:microcystin-dependent protein